MISPLPDVKVLSLCQQDDFVIIACDGIWNSLTSQQAVNFVCESFKDDPDVQLSSVCEQVSLCGILSLLYISLTPISEFACYFFT